MDPKRVLFASLRGLESEFRKSSSGPRREQRLVKILFENSGGADVSSKRSNSPAAVTPRTCSGFIFVSGGPDKKCRREVRAGERLQHYSQFSREHRFSFSQQLKSSGGWALGTRLVRAHTRKRALYTPYSNIFCKEALIRMCF